jgi:hypothetical protein
MSTRSAAISARSWRASGIGRPTRGSSSSTCRTWRRCRIRAGSRSPRSSGSRRFRSAFRRRRTRSDRRARTFYTASYYSSDGFHPNDAGYRRLADLVVAAAVSGTVTPPRASCVQMAFF